VPLRLSVVTPEREVLSGPADLVVARAADGDIGILPGHAPFLAALGHARLLVASGETTLYLAVHGGFIEVLDDRVTVLTTLADRAEEIDVAAVRSEHAEAEAARAALRRARTRLQTAAEAGLLDIG
jgi:F-type H+-transporting ATPase subunit epsilon